MQFPPHIFNDNSVDVRVEFGVGVRVKLRP